DVDTISASVSKGARVLASPLARVIARQNGIALAGIPGTGPGDRIVKADVEKALAALPGQPAEQAATARVVTTPEVRREHSSPAPQAWQLHEAVANSTMRKTIARRLSEAKQRVPHFYLTVSVKMDRALVLRGELNARPGASYKL